MNSIPQPVPLIDEKRARRSREKAFSSAERLLDVVDSQVSKLQEICQADLSLSEMIAEEGAIETIKKQMERIPVMLEMAKEASHPLTKLVGILRSEAPIPGEPKAFASAGAGEPQEPEKPTSPADEARALLKLWDSESETKKKPRKRQKAS